jgi:hypothetical protein
MDYGKILKRSAELTWHNKLLWVLGILAALFSGSAGNPGSGMQYTTNSQELRRLWGNTPFPDFPVGRMPLRWEQFAAIGVGVAVLIFLAVMVLAVVGAIVRYTSEGALVAAVDDLDGGRKPTFREAIGRGWKRFLRLLAQDLVIGLVTAIGVMVLLLVYAIVAGLLLAPGIVMIANDGGARGLGIAWVVLLGLVFGLILMALLVAIGAITTAVQAYAQRASVLELEGVFDAIGSGLKLFRARWRQSVAMWLWLALVSLVIGLVMVPVVLLLLALVAAPSAGLYALSRSPLLTGVVAVPLFTAFILVMLWIGGLLTAFKSAVWTLTYNELMAEGEVALQEV